MNAVYRSETGRDLVQARYRELLARWPVGTRQLLVPTREGETFVVNCGAAGAPPVVMLQGSGANAAMWLPDIEAYAQRVRVYAVDVIGEPGASAQSRPRVGSAAYAEWLDDVLDGLNLDRAALVGVSLGRAGPGLCGTPSAAGRPISAAGAQRHRPAATRLPRQGGPSAAARRPRPPQAAVVGAGRTRGAGGSA